ncbi:ABC transporter ATP-binding protein [Brucellaceae bacterium C25G]
MIELNNVTIKRGTQTVLSQLNTKLEAGKIHVIIGPNGTGKTTLLRAVFGELPLHEGMLSQADKTLKQGNMPSRHLRLWRDTVAYMPQDSTTDVALTVLEVVVLGRIGKLSLHIDDETLHMAMTRLEEAGIAHLADRYVTSLSGGQRQMVMFAQVLMRQPKIMLLDEPVSALDLKHQIGLLDLVRRETRLNGWVTIIVLHDLNLACQYADNLLVLANGSLQASGVPSTIITADLIDRTYGVQVEILRDQSGHPVIQPVAQSLEKSFEDKKDL